MCGDWFEIGHVTIRSPLHVKSRDHFKPITKMVYRIKVLQGEIERRWTLKVRWTPGGLWPLPVNLNIAPPFVLIRVMHLVHTNSSCRYKRVEPRHASGSQKSYFVRYPM